MRSSCSSKLGSACPSSPPQIKPVTNRQLELGSHLPGRFPQRDAGRKAADNSQPLRRELPVLAALVRSREGPAVTRVVTGWAVKSAQLVRVEIIVSHRQALSRPLEAPERKSGVEPHKELILSGRVGAHRRVAVQVLRDERPVSGGRQASPKTRETCP